MARSYNLSPESNYELFIAVTAESHKFSTKFTSNEDVSEIKLEPDDFNGSMVDVSEQIENNFNCSELSENVHKFGENILGNSYYKKS